MSTSSRAPSASKSSSGPSNTGVLTSRRGPAKGGSTTGKAIATNEREPGMVPRLSQVYRVEPFDPADRSPPVPQGCCTGRLARVRQPSIGPGVEHGGHNELERRGDC